MSWLSELLSRRDSKLTFDQDLELFVARWQVTRGERMAMHAAEIAGRLHDKAEKLLQQPEFRPPPSREDVD